MERDFKSLAVVIKKERKGERDSFITLLTPDMGILRVVAFGSGRSTKLGSIYSLYDEGVFSLSRRGEDSIIIRDKDIISSKDWIRGDLDCLTMCSLFSELVISSHSSTSEIYSLFVSVLDRMENENIDRLTVYFIVHFLSLEGLSGDWESCPICQRRYFDDEILGFSIEDRIVCCSNCDSLNRSLILPPNARRYILRVSQVGLDEALEFNISDSFVKKISSYLIRMLSLSFPKELKTIKSGLIDKD